MSAPTFERALEALQDALLDPAYQGRVSRFIDAHCSKFPLDSSDKDGMSHELYSLFQEYHKMVEGSLEKTLKKHVNDLEAFTAWLLERAEEGDFQAEDTLDVLSAESDFEVFCEQMREARRGKEGELEGMVVVSRIQGKELPSAKGEVQYVLDKDEIIAS